MKVVMNHVDDSYELCLCGYSLLLGLTFQECFDNVLSTIPVTGIRVCHTPNKVYVCTNTKKHF